MKKILVTLSLLLSMVYLSYAQEYHFAIGGRLGKMNTGLSAKYMGGRDNNSGMQLELYRTYIYSRGWTGKLFYVRQGEFRIPILQIPLDYIYGGGFHVGYFPWPKKSPTVGTYYCRYKDGQCANYGKTVFSAGLDATLQIEYQVPLNDLPLTVSIDSNLWGLGQALSFEFVHKGAEWIDFGFTVRYAFVGR